MPPQPPPESSIYPLNNPERPVLQASLAHLRELVAQDPQQQAEEQVDQTDGHYVYQLNRAADFNFLTQFEGVAHITQEVLTYLQSKLKAARHLLIPDGYDSSALKLEIQELDMLVDPDTGILGFDFGNYLELVEEYRLFLTKKYGPGGKTLSVVTSLMKGFESPAELPPDELGKLQEAVKGLFFNVSKLTYYHENFCDQLEQALEVLSKLEAEIKRVPVSLRLTLTPKPRS